MSGYEKIKPEMGYKSGDNSIIRRSVYHFYFILFYFIIYHITAGQACELRRFSRILHVIL